jgi:small-conductance mechanosensitive channel
MKEKILRVVSSKPFVSIVVILCISYLLHKVINWMLFLFLAKHGVKTQTRKVVTRIVNYTYWTLVGIFFIAFFSRSLAAIGISAAFLGMMLGWSLQRPVTGIAAWLLIMLKRPFKVGDRVIIAGIIGDVVEIGPMYVLLNQVGGTIGGEEQSGRGVLIPTAILFDQVVYNYTLETEYILDEVGVRLTFDSDWHEAEKILISAAKEVTKEIIEKTGQEPYIRAVLFDAGVLMQLRYNTIPARRQEISTEITKRIFLAFKNNPKVKFCYPHIAYVKGTSLLQQSSSV